MNTVKHIAHRCPRLVLGLLMTCAAASGASADPQSGAPAAPAAGGAQQLESKGLYSSLKQAFKQDFDKEIVRGHFDVGSPPDSHRYYCLVDPKTGKSEVNGAAGDTYVRRDGVTAIKNASVSFYSCVEAQQKGLLVTSGYVLSGKAAVAANAQPAAPPVAAAAPAAAAAPVPAAASVPAAAAASVPAPPVVAPAPPESSLQLDVMAVYTRFIAGQNAHDRGIVSEVLLNSPDFVWAQYGEIRSGATPKHWRRSSSSGRAPGSSIPNCRTCVSPASRPGAPS